MYIQNSLADAVFVYDLWACTSLLSTMQVISLRLLEPKRTPAVY